MGLRPAAWLLFAFSSFASAQSAEAPDTRPTPDLNEHVEVVNVEVVARVKKDGRPVGGLTKEDFLLEVNGRRIAINGFREEHRRIGRTPHPDGFPPLRDASKETERLFVLCFWLWDRNAAYSDALRHFFGEIYRPSDRVILAHTHGIETIDSPDQVAAKRTRFEETLEKSIDADNIARQQLYSQIDDGIKEYLGKPASAGGRSTKGDSDPSGSGQSKANNDIRRGPLQKLLSDTWKEFKARFLKGDARALTRLADQLKPVRGEKWVLVFLQEEQFPIFEENGRVPAAFGNPLEEMRKTMGDETSEFDERVRSAFINAETTLNLIRLNCRNREEQGRSPYYRLKAIHSNREDAFRQISQVTGGSMIDDNNLVRALNRAAAREDIFYVMSFAPSDIRRKMEIHLACHDASMTVYAGRRNRYRDPNQLVVDELRMSRSTLTFRLRGYARLYENGRLQGRVQVHIQAGGAGLPTLESRREFRLPEPEADIPVTLHLPPGRSIRFVIRVLDQITGRELIKKRALQPL